MQEYHLHTKKSAEKIKQKDHQQEKTSKEKISSEKINIRKPVFRKIRIETEPDGELPSLPGSFVIIR